jgi:threonine synthase
MSSEQSLELLEEDTLSQGATASSLEGAEIQSLRATATDLSLPLGERLEAYEDLTDAEVGDTDLTRARNIEREVGLRQIYLKFEGGNPSGTQKDRIAFAHVLDAMRRGYDRITVATCGNFGSAVATAAAAAGLHSIVYIPETYQSKRLDEMEASGASIVRCPGDYERSVELSRELAAQEDVYDANPGGANSDLQMRAYGQIAYELYDELRDAPAAVAVPVSNGTTLAGIHRGFVSLYRRGKTSRIPRMVAGSSFRKNPIVQAWLKGDDQCDDLEPGRIAETSVNEPLINWHSIDGDLALQAVRQTGGWAGFGSDKSMTNHARMIREQQGLSVLPASTAGLLALIEQHHRDPLPGDRYVAILTGRKQ